MNAAPNLSCRRVHRTRLSLALPAAMLMTLSAQAAFAQDAPADTKTLDRITVTGSNIPRTTTETASPIQIISREQIDRTGKTTVGEYLQSLSVDGAG